MTGRPSGPSRTVIIFAFCIVFGILLPACTDVTDDETQSLIVRDLQLKVHPGGARIISGRLSNQKSDPVSVAQIQITLFDQDNRAVSGMSVLVHNILPGEEVSFREPVDSDTDISGARVKNILVP